MALTPEQLERIHQLQRQLDARSRLDTERDLYKLLQQYDEIAKKAMPLRRQALRFIEAGEMDAAEAVIDRLGRQVGQALAQLEHVERQAIESMIEHAALKGVAVVDLAPAAVADAKAALDELLDSLDQIAASGGVPALGVGVAYGELTQAAKDAIMSKIYDDGLNLSPRLHRRLAENRAEFHRLLSEGLAEGRGAIRLAKQIQELDVTDPKFPKYLRELERTLKGTKDTRLVNEIRAAAQEAAKRKKGSLGLQGPAKRVVQAARSGSAQRLDDAIDYFLQRKARYHAIVIARTEANAAFREAHVRKAQQTAWVIGVAWRLSNSHPRPDI